MKIKRTSYLKFKNYFKNDSDINITTDWFKTTGDKLTVYLRKKDSKSKNILICKLFEISSKDKVSIGFIKEIIGDAQAHFSIRKQNHYRAVSIIFAAHILNHEYNEFVESGTSSLYFEKMKFVIHVDGIYNAVLANSRPFFTKQQGLDILKDFSFLALRYPFPSRAKKIYFPPDRLANNNKLLTLKRSSTPEDSAKTKKQSADPMQEKPVPKQTDPASAPASKPAFAQVDNEARAQRKSKKLQKDVVLQAIENEKYELYINGVLQKRMTDDQCKFIHKLCLRALNPSEDRCVHISKLHELDYVSTSTTNWFSLFRNKKIAALLFQRPRKYIGLQPYVIIKKIPILL